MTLILFAISLWLVYLGYKFNAIIVFVFGTVYDSAWAYLKGLVFPRAAFLEKRGAGVLRFRWFTREFEMVVPSDLLESGGPKITAMSRGQNCSERMRELMGPASNFFGMKVTPANCGLKVPLSVWLGRRRYEFRNENEPILFDREVRDDA